MVNIRFTDLVHAPLARLVSIVQTTKILSLAHLTPQLDFRYPVQPACIHLRDQDPVQPVLMASLVTSQVF
jgi:hypothetical protein